MSVAPQANQPNALALPPAPPPATRGSIESEIDAELAGSIAPLEREAAQLGLNETRAIQDLNSLFSGLMPFVAGSAQRVAANYGATNAAQQSIFAEAWSRLNALQSERAGRAQELAQQIGAPIPMDMFSAGIDLERMAFVPEAAGELLKASTIGQAGVQEAEAFAGRVFPLQKVRLETQTHNFYRDQITSLRSQIATLKSQKPGMVNERLRQRQLEDYEMKLARAEAAFDRYSTKRGLKLEEERLRMQEEQWRREAGLTKRGQDLGAKADKDRNALNNRTYVNAKKQDITNLSVALATGGSQDVERKQLVRQPDGSLKSVSYTDTIKQAGIKSPTRLLNQILAQTGIQKGQKELYNFAVKQVIQALKINGVSGIPNDPSKWDKWFKTWQKKHTPKPKPSPTAGGTNVVLNDPQPPPGLDTDTSAGGNKGGKGNKGASGPDQPVPYSDTGPGGKYVYVKNGVYYLSDPISGNQKITKKAADQYRKQWGRP